jgi:hypothetical protein
VRSQPAHSYAVVIHTTSVGARHKQRSAMVHHVCLCPLMFCKAAKGRNSPADQVTALGAGVCVPRSLLIKYDACSLHHCRWHIGVLLLLLSTP